MTGVSPGPLTFNFSLALENSSGSSNRFLLKMALGDSILSGGDGESVVIKAAYMFQDYLVVAAFGFPSVWFGYKVFPIGVRVCACSTHLWTLFGKVVETLGDRAILEEACLWK